MNRDGHPSTLVARHPGNTNRLQHGVFSADRRALEPRAREIAERVLEAPHTIELDEIGAAEIGRLQALIEAVDADIAARGLTGKRGDVRAIVDLRLRASRRLAEWLDRYGLNPHARAEWAQRMASAAEFKRRLAEIDAEERGS